MAPVALLVAALSVGGLLGLYFLKSLLGIDLINGPSPVHEFFDAVRLAVAS